MCAVLGALFTSVSAQWVKQKVDTTASFRGLSVVNEKVVWASGTGGTVIRTIDGGKTWDVNIVPGAEKLDFRDIEAFDENEAYILSIGNGESSRIYHTTNGGTIWELQFKNANAKAFFDAIACWDRNRCIAMSDPVDNKFVLINTIDGGFHWKPIDTSKMPRTKDGEAAFAASGTCLITQGKNNAFLVSGGNDARVFRSTDRGKTWAAFSTPIVHGTSGSGIFSITMFNDKNGVIVGGDYEKADQARDSAAFTKDGGKTWKLGNNLGGYRSGAAIYQGSLVIAVGTNGSDISSDSGASWKADGKQTNLNAIGGYAGARRWSIWGVGVKGLVVNRTVITVAP